ncbi:MAG: hypothetical protein AAFR74_00385 [Pseudomonadota bacterium]
MLTTQKRITTIASVALLSACATAPTPALDAGEVASVQSGEMGVIAFANKSDSSKCLISSFIAYAEADYDKLIEEREARKIALDAGEDYEEPEDDDDDEGYVLGAITDGRDVGAAAVPPGSYVVEPVICSQIVAYSPTAVIRNHIILNEGPVFTPVEVKAGEVSWLPLVAIKEATYVRDEEEIRRFMEIDDDRTREDALEPITGFQFQTVVNGAPDGAKLEPYLGMFPMTLTVVEMSVVDGDSRNMTKPIAAPGVLETLE